MRWLVVISMAAGLCGACQASGPAGVSAHDIGAQAGAAPALPTRQPRKAAIPDHPQAPLLEAPAAIDRPMGCIRGPFGCDD